MANKTDEITLNLTYGRYLLLDLDVRMDVSNECQDRVYPVSISMWTLPSNRISLYSIYSATTSVTSPTRKSSASPATHSYPTRTRTESYEIVTKD